MHFNVIIPTRERSDTLYWSLKTVVEQDYHDLTIIVSDNCSNDNTREVVERFDDKRIVYLKTPKRLSMSHNWEFALNHVEKGFVTIVGDDDGLIPGAIRKASQLISEHKVKALCWQTAHYYWNTVANEQFRGLLTVPTKNNYTLLDSKREIEKTVRNIFHGVFLPAYYWGFSDIAIFKAAKRNGAFFHSFQPDIYSGVVIANQIEKYIYSYTPLGISGSSHHSSGQAYLGKDFDKTSNQKFFKEDNIPTHPAITIAPSNAILLSEPILQANEIFPELPKMDLKTIIMSGLYEACTCGDEEKYKEIVTALKTMAEKNSLSKYLNYLLKKNTFIKDVKTEKKESEKHPEKIIIDTCNYKSLPAINNIYDACKFLSHQINFDKLTFKKNMSSNEHLLSSSYKTQKAIADIIIGVKSYYER